MNTYLAKNVCASTKSSLKLKIKRTTYEKPCNKLESFFFLMFRKKNVYLLYLFFL